MLEWGETFPKLCAAAQQRLSLDFTEPTELQTTLPALCRAAAENHQQTSLKPQQPLFRPLTIFSRSSAYRSPLRSTAARSPLTICIKKPPPNMLGKRRNRQPCQHGTLFHGDLYRLQQVPRSTIGNHHSPYTDVSGHHDDLLSTLKLGEILNGEALVLLEWG